MRQRHPFVSSLVGAGLVALALCACGTGFDGSAAPAEGHRLVTGALVPPTFVKNAVALQLAAVAIDTSQDAPIRAVVTSAPFGPAANDGRPVPFRLAMPFEGTFILVLQTPGSAQQGIGELVARVRFARDAAGTMTDLVSGRLPGSPAPMADLDLGTVKIATPAASNASNGGPKPTDNLVLLGEGTAINPLSKNDVDGDGTPDVDDSDDDNDLIPDEGDEDADGDGIADAMQTFEALLAYDANNDGVPDPFQP